MRVDKDSPLSAPPARLDRGQATQLALRDGQVWDHLVVGAAETLTVHPGLPVRSPRLRDATTKPGPKESAQAPCVLTTSPLASLL